MDANEKHLTMQDPRHFLRLKQMIPGNKLLLSGFLASCALMISLISWTLSSPLGSSPDENFHIGSIWCAEGEKDGRCAYVNPSGGEQSNPVIVPHVMDVCFIFYAEQSANCSGDPRSKKPELVANSSLYPKLFYATHNLLVSDKTQVSGLAMRLLNSFVACFVLFMAIILSPLRTRASGLIPFVVTLIPLAIFLIPSLNPSSWAYIGVGFAWIFQLNATLMSNISANRNKQIRLANWFMFMFCAALAMGSRWDSVVYSCLSIVIVFLIARFERIEVKFLSIMLPALVLLVGITLLVSHYWMTAVSGVPVFGNPESISSGWTVENRNLHNLVNLISLPAGVFGLNWGIGWLDTPLPAIVGIVGVAAYGYFFLASIPYRLKSHYFLILLLGISTTGILMYYLSGSSIVVGELVQPRYILPMVPLILGVGIFSARFESFLSEMAWARIAFIGALIATLHSISLWTNIRRYTLGLEPNQGYNLSNPTTPIEWWWRWAPSPNFVFLVGTVSFSIFIFTILRIVSHSTKFDESLCETKSSNLRT